MRISKVFAAVAGAALVAVQSFGLGSSSLTPAPVADALAPEAAVLQVLDIRGLDNLLAAAEELVGGTAMAPKGFAAMQVGAIGASLLGVDPLQVLDGAALQRVVFFKNGDDMGMACILAPVGGIAGLNERLKKVWASVPVPAAAAKALPAGTAVYESTAVGRLFVMPYSPTQVVVLPAGMRAGIRPRALFDLLQSLPHQIAAEGQLAVRVDQDTWRKALAAQDGLASKMGLALDADDDSLIEQFESLAMVSFGVGVRDGALAFDTVVRLAEGSKLAKQYAALTGSVTRAASSLWLPGAVAAIACHTYPGNSEAMNMAKLSLLDFCTHGLPDDFGTAAADLWRLMFDLFEPFGPDYGFAIYEGVEGNELPMAFYASLADPSFKGPKAQEFIASLPKRFFKVVGQMIQDDSLGAGRSEPLPVIFDYVGTEKLDGVPVDTWNVVLTDCSENELVDRPRPFTLATFKVAYLEDAIIVADGGDVTDIGLQAIMRRLRSADTPLLAETAPFREAMPLDATEAQSVGYAQLFDLVRAVDAFRCHISHGEPLPFVLPEGPGTVSYACQQPQDGILRQTVGVSVKTVRDLVDFFATLDGSAAAAPATRRAEAWPDGDDW